MKNSGETPKPREMEPGPPIIIEDPEQSRLDPTLPDGGLPPAVGVESYQVLRASRDVPNLTDGKGWTYHHHVDMGCWRGRLYVGWNSCQRDEDVWPSRELFSTSVNGRTWTQPAELFPQGVSTPLRMYFYFAREAGRMLAIAGLRVDTADTSEDRKGALVVREIHDDHTLGEVYLLSARDSDSLSPYSGRGQGRGASADAGALPLEGCSAAGPSPQPSPRVRGEGVRQFTDASDQGFIAACRTLLADRVFLEQQDRGKLLGPGRMKWHDAAAWPAGAVPGDSEKWVAGKAYSFYRRPDGVLVGISKMGWTTTSPDDGERWTRPLVPPTLVTGKAKVWSQRTDGRYALVYNPSRKNRYPLVVVTGDDGVHFRDMRLVQGELPIQRYEGRFRSIGPQYVRGISTWSGDGSRADDGVMWLVYSMSKEDIWVSRVPLNAAEDAWGVYAPKWAPVTVEGNLARLEDRDPYDYAAVTRVLPRGRSCEVLAEQPGTTLYAEIVEEAGRRFVAITPEAAGEWQPSHLNAGVARVTLRTGPPRGVGGTQPVPPGSDRPAARVAFRVRVSP